jgi:hypothetical protein
VLWRTVWLYVRKMKIMYALRKWNTKWLANALLSEKNALNWQKYFKNNFMALEIHQRQPTNREVLGHEKLRGLWGKKLLPADFLLVSLPAIPVSQALSGDGEQQLPTISGFEMGKQRQRYIDNHRQRDNI